MTFKINNLEINAIGNIYIPCTLAILLEVLFNLPLTAILIIGTVALPLNLTQTWSRNITKYNYILAKSQKLYEN